MKFFALILTTLLTLLSCSSQPIQTNKSQSVASSTRYFSPSTITLVDNFFVTVNDTLYTLKKSEKLNLKKESIVLWARNKPIGFFNYEIEKLLDIDDIGITINDYAYEYLDAFQKSSKVKSVEMQRNEDFKSPKDIEIESYILKVIDLKNRIRYQIIYYSKLDNGLHATQVFVIESFDLKQVTKRSNTIMQTAFQK